MDTTQYRESVPDGALLRHVTTPAGRIALWDRPGEGTPLVLVHGNSSSKSAFRRLMAQAPLHPRRLLALDLPGAGESDDAGDPESVYTFTGLARTVRDALSALDIGRPVVLGWSLGGHLAIEAVGQGADFAGLILTGTPPCGPGAEEIGATFHANELMSVGLTESPQPEALSAYINALYAAEGSAEPELAAAGRRFDGRLRHTMAVNMLTGTPPQAHRQRDVVAQWPGPIAMIQGDQEPFFDPKGPNSLEWRNLWRGAGQMVAGTGHAPFHQRPDLYAGLVAAFLRDIGA